MAWHALNRRQQQQTQKQQHLQQIEREQNAVENNVFPIKTSIPKGDHYTTGFNESLHRNAWSLLSSVFTYRCSLHDLFPFNLFHVRWKCNGEKTRHDASYYGLEWMKRKKRDLVYVWRWMNHAFYRFCVCVFFVMCVLNEILSLCVQLNELNCNKNGTKKRSHKSLKLLEGNNNKAAKLKITNWETRIIWYKSGACLFSPTNAKPKWWNMWIVDFRGFVSYFGNVIQNRLEQHYSNGWQTTLDSK